MPFHSLNKSDHLILFLLVLLILHEGGWNSCVWLFIELIHHLGEFYGKWGLHLNLDHPTLYNSPLMKENSRDVISGNKRRAVFTLAFIIWILSRTQYSILLHMSECFHTGCTCFCMRWSPMQSSPWLFWPKRNIFLLNQTNPWTHRPVHVMHVIKVEDYGVQRLFF